MEKLYEAIVSANGGRNGHVKSSDGVLDMPVRMPEGLGGQGGKYTNPEQLFAAAYSACFDGALNLVARQNRIKLKETTVTAHVALGKNKDGGLELAVRLDVNIPEIDRETALSLLEKAHNVCPYSLAVKNNIDVSLNLV